MNQMTLCAIALRYLRAKVKLQLAEECFELTSPGVRENAHAEVLSR